MCPFYVCAEHLPADVYIDVQGDEPFVSPAAFDAVPEVLRRLTPGTLALNAYTELDDRLPLCERATKRSAVVISLRRHRANFVYE